MLLAERYTRAYQAMHHGGVFYYTVLRTPGYSNINTNLVMEK